MSVRVLLNGGREISDHTPHGSFAFVLDKEASGRALTVIDENGRVVGHGRMSIDAPITSSPPALIESPRNWKRPGDALAMLFKLFGVEEDEQCQCRKLRSLFNARGWVWLALHPIFVIRNLIASYKERKAREAASTKT